MKTNSKFLLFFSGLTASFILLSYCNGLGERQEAQWKEYLDASRSSTEKLSSSLEDLASKLEKVEIPVEEIDCEE